MTAKVLVVEDEPTTQSFIKAILKSEDIEPLIADNGAKGLYHYITESYDAVILDFMMPEVRGEVFLKVADSLDRSGLLPATPKIICYTAISDFDEIRHYMDMRCVYCILQKPATSAEILRNLNAIFRAKDQS